MDLDLILDMDLDLILDLDLDLDLVPDWSSDCHLRILYLRYTGFKGL